MAVRIASSAIRTCFGDGAATFEALLRGRCGARPVAHLRAARLNVAASYQIADPDERGEERWFRASAWLAECVRRAMADAAIDPVRDRVVVIVGTGLRELRAVERAVDEPLAAPAERLHFADVVRRAAPGVADVITVSNACSASGHALAIAQDLVELGEVDAAVAAGTDAMTESMLAMIGRFAAGATDRVRPFDRRRSGALLGEGAAAQVVVPDEGGRPALARVLATGLSCDAFHDTAPSAEGVWRAVADAFARARRTPDAIDFVVAHGTGTSLNDAMEASLLGRTYGAQRPPITAVKGALGHTSGTAALVNVDVAIRCIDAGVLPPIVGLEEPLPEGEALGFVINAPCVSRCRTAQVNAFGFGGVNAVTLLEAVA